MKLSTLFAVAIILVFAIQPFDCLSKGYNSDVAQAQKKLKVLGYNPGPSDGIWGTKTRDAILKFQRENRLQETGTLDDETSKQLSLQTKSSPDSSWNESILKSDKMAAIRYLRDNPGTERAQQLMGFLEPHGRPGVEYVATGSFLDFVRENSTPTITRCSIRQVDRRYAEANGMKVALPDAGTRKPGSTSTGLVAISMAWNPGATHTILGSLVVFDYCFVSDRDNPLRFVMTNTGYRYKAGSGVVVDPEGEVVILGKGVGIHFATTNGDLEAVRKLLTGNPSLVLKKDDNGHTPLHIAAGNGSEDIVRLLLASDADVNATDANGATPLHEAVARGHENVTKLLLANGADASAADINGGTPLHTAAFRGHRAVAALLLSSGVDAGARDEQGSIPLHKAAWNGSTDVTALLLAHEADVNSQDNEGYTSLHLAAYRGFPDVVKLLLDEGASVNVKSNKGTTPLGLATTGKHESVAELLRQNGGSE